MLDLKKEISNNIAKIIPNTKLRKMDDNILEIREIGTGNINYIYKIQYSDNISIILKHAKERARISKEIILSPKRNHWEANAMKICKKYNDKFIPTVYLINPHNSYFIMEDLSDYTDLKVTLNNGNIVEYFIDNLKEYFENVIQSIDKIKYEVDNMASAVNNNIDLINLTKRLVFEEPYIESTNNVHSKQNKDYIYHKLYTDKEVKKAVLEAKMIFESQKTTLIHGDLHTGSILISNEKKDIRIIDYEFAMIGPLSYDVGNLLAHFTMIYIYEEYKKNKKSKKGSGKFLNWISDVIEFILSIINKNSYLDDNKIIRLSEMFSATEIIRRTIGLAKFYKMQDYPEEDKIILEKICISVGRKLLLEPGLFTDMTEYLDTILNIIKNSK